MSDFNDFVDATGKYAESVDALLKAIADDDSTAFTAAIAIVGMRRTALDEAGFRVMGVAA